MIRQSTVRLPVAVFVTVAAAIVSTMAGRADAAVLAAPWLALLVLGLAGGRREHVEATVSLAEDRVVSGDDVEVITRVRADRGWVETLCRPDARFWPRGSVDQAARPSPMGDVIASDGRVELRSSFPAMVWGTHDLGRVEVQLHEPYGLLRWTGVVRQPARVRVHPQANEIRRLLAPWFVRRLSGAHGSTAVDRGVEYADIRPFGSGDSLRDINWRASARSDELWVSQRHPDRATDVILLLDSFVESGHDVRAVVGAAIEAAVALAESHLAMTDRVGLVELGGVVRWVSPGTGRLQLQRLIDALLSTGLYANAADRDLTLIPPRALPPRSFVVAMSPLFDPRFIDALFTLRGGGHDVAVIDCSPIDEDHHAPDATESARLARRLWFAERGIDRDRLSEQGVSIGRWTIGTPLDPTLAELSRQRQRARRGSAR